MAASGERFRALWLYEHVVEAQLLAHGSGAISRFLAIAGVESCLIVIRSPYGFHVTVL